MKRKIRASSGVRLLCIFTIGLATYVLLSQVIPIQRAINEKEAQEIKKYSFWQKNEEILQSSRAQFKDWHDVDAMEREATRTGPGERGEPVYINDPSKLQLKQQMTKKNGFNALLSDVISVNRSVPDIRFHGCRMMKYFADLPTVSIIIPFYNEHFSALLRSLHSVANRTPPELIKEIILVDDFSDRVELKTQLDEYVKKDFPKVDIIRLPKRKGLILARLAGAIKAVGDVLVFMDSHIEANYNWLPPLLHLIAQDKRTVVCPMIDVINDETFSYTAQDEGARGAFDWTLDYKRLPMLERDLKDPTKPFENPIMAGGLFSIAREWFWELGGYDDGLDIWGGEQYDLSFKIWMCGGRLLDVPCSRVGHIFRNDKWPGVPNNRKGDYLHKNYKRIVEVWMDDYKKYVYQHAPGLYEKIKEGDLTEPKAVRQNLNCKSFKWFMENVAFDLVKHYPPRGTADFAFGQVRSVGAPNLCLDTLGPPDYGPIGIKQCEEDAFFPSRNQDWSLSENHDLRMRGEDYCLQTTQRKGNSMVLIYDCHIGDTDQLWYYNRKMQWLVYGKNRNFCLEARPDFHQVVVDRCALNNPLMKWAFVHVNETLLDKYFDTLPK
ncbi:N-acetylgalactosaminyltransferase 6-like [Rhagoletis pomonella]|uniref:N-acetylgalactosaminyltransferase 6-like n=1 Tax=Rhagoletis pomonella TaxID=28610 RepID=UPI001782EDE9|nr:N-acetylgalactosaminyltransferase 6-like [Rhagoletis pomonella]